MSNSTLNNLFNRQAARNSNRDDVISIDPKSAALLLFAIAVCLVLLSITAQLSVYYFGEHPPLTWFERLFDVHRELNVPTLYSSLLLFSSSVLLALIARAKKGERFVKHWWALAGIFLWLTLDEALTIHEQTTDLIRLFYNSSGYFYWGWVLPYGSAMAIFLVAYRNFLSLLPARTRWLFLAAGFIYVSGALGLEMVEANRYESLNQQRDAFFYALVTVEEMLEMSGLVLFVYALLCYMESEMKGVLNAAICRAQELLHHTAPHGNQD